MLDRNDRNIKSHHGARLAREISRARYDMLASNVALVGLHQPFARGKLLNGGHRGVAVNLRTPAARPLGQSLGEIRGLDVAVIGMLDGADDPVRFAQWPN